MLKDPDRRNHGAPRPDRLSIQYLNIKASEVCRSVTARIRALPGFLVIGAQRSGSTSLYTYLTRHSSIAGATRKEVHFFDFNYERGTNWYRRHFPLVATLKCTGSVTGEATPYYLFHPCAAERAAMTLPAVKVITLLRNPIHRAYSHYHDEVRKGRETLGFEDAVDAEQDRLAGEAEKLKTDNQYYSYNHRRFSYLSRGRYAEQLRIWLRHFPRENFFIRSSEEFYEQPVQVVDELCDFLGIQREPGIAEKIQQMPKFNEGAYQEMSTATYDILRQYFYKYNNDLWGLIGRDLGWNQ